MSATRAQLLHLMGCCGGDGRWREWSTSAPLAWAARLHAAGVRSPGGESDNEQMDKLADLAEITRDKDALADLLMGRGWILSGDHLSRLDHLCYHCGGPMRASDTGWSCWTCEFGW